MDNQHKAIKGYRDLSAAEIAMMNKIKALAEQAGSLVAELRSIGATPTGSPPQADEGWFGSTVDPRWISIGATNLQTGFMALTRAVAQPTTF